MTEADTKHLELLKQNENADSVIIENALGKLLKMENTRPSPLYLTPCKIRMGESFLHSDQEESACFVLCIQKLH